VLVFEPAADNADLLEANVRLNGLADAVEVVRAAAGAEETAMYLARDLSCAAGSRHVSNRGAHYLTRANGADATPVRVTTIDAATANWRRVDAVKIDVEGFEWHVLQGMRRTLARNEDLALFVEFWPSAIKRAGAEPAHMLSLLEAEGFTLWEIRRPGGLHAYQRDALLNRLTGPTDLVDLLCLRGNRFTIE
jgi:FkbM family methyltransferase